jgi:hypothetical protein
MKIGMMIINIKKDEDPEQDILAGCSGPIALMENVLRSKLQFFNMWCSIYLCTVILSFLTYVEIFFLSKLMSLKVTLTYVLKPILIVDILSDPNIH